MYRQGGCGQREQGTVDNSNGRERATCGVLGFVLATYWATVRYNADKARPSQIKSIMENEVRRDKICMAFHSTLPTYLKL